MPQMRHESIGAAQKKVHLGLYAACFKDCSYTTEIVIACKIWGGGVTVRQAEVRGFCHQVAKKPSIICNNYIGKFGHNRQTKEFVLRSFWCYNCPSYKQCYKRGTFVQGM